MIASRARLVRLFSKLRKFFYGSGRALSTHAPQQDCSQQSEFAHVGASMIAGFHSATVVDDAARWKTVNLQQS